jgi:hypothetical protein
MFKVGIADLFYLKTFSLFHTCIRITFVSMLKRVVIYGLAFGSLSASMIFINFLNQLYQHRNALSAIPTLANIFILAFGVYLLVRQLMNVPMDKPLTLGKTLFGTLSMALIAALCNIAAYSHIQNNQIEKFEAFKSMQIQAIQKYVQQDTSLKTSDARMEKLNTAISNLEEKLKVGTYASFEIQMYLSISMIITLLVYVAVKK